MEIFEELKEILNDLHPELDFDVEENLIDDGILDSLDIVNLVTEINDCFNVSIGAVDIVPENFNSLQAIADLVQRLIDEE